MEADTHKPEAEPSSSPSPAPNAPALEANANANVAGAESFPFPSSAPNANVLGAGIPSFIREDLLDDSAPGTSIADFRSPKLRQFRKYDQRISWRKYIGYGMNGIVFRVRFDDGDGPYALKVVCIYLFPFAYLLTFYII